MRFLKAKIPRPQIYEPAPIWACTQIGAILSQTNHGVHMSPWASIKPRYQIENPFFSLVQLRVDSPRNPVLTGFRLVLSRIRFPKSVSGDNNCWIFESSIAALI